MVKKVLRMALKSSWVSAGEIELVMEMSSSKFTLETPSPLLLGSSDGPVLGRPMNPSVKPPDGRLRISVEWKTQELSSSHELLTAGMSVGLRMLVRVTTLDTTSSRLFTLEVDSRKKVVK